MKIREWLTGPAAQERAKSRNAAEIRRRIYVHGGRAAVRALDAHEAAGRTTRAGRAQGTDRAGRVPRSR